MTPPPYEAQTITCVGCAERARFEKFFGKEGLEPGVTVILVPTDETEYDEELFTEPARVER